jgi:Transposase IS4
MDEIMVRFEGRSSGITIILGKPMPIGFKYFALVDKGYIYNYEYTTPGTIEGEKTENTRNREVSIP